MKRTLVFAGVLAALLAAWPAVAQQGSRGPHGRQGAPMSPPPGRPMPPAREPGPVGPRGQPPMERMTPEDRRQLRQDIHQYGRDVYRGRPADDKR